MRANFKSHWLLPVNNFFLRVKTILTRPMRFFSQKVVKNLIFARTPSVAGLAGLSIFWLSIQLNLLQFSMLNNCFAVITITPNIRWQNTFKCPLTLTFLPP